MLAAEAVCWPGRWRILGLWAAAPLSLILLAVPVSWWPGWTGWLTDQQEVCGTWVPVKQQCVICASDCDGCAREPFAVAVREKKINHQRKKFF